MTIKTGDIIRIKTPKGYRVWHVTGVYHGAAGQEDVATLETLDKTAGTVYGKEALEMACPLMLLEANPLANIL